jgi:hypothetical protein
MIAIENSEQLLLAGWGLLKVTMDQIIEHYLVGKWVRSICHIAESLYLIGLHYDGLIVWNEDTDQQLFKICRYRVSSIKRILTTNTFIIKTYKKGLKSLTIKNIKNS